MKSGPKNPDGYCAPEVDEDEVVAIGDGRRPPTGIGGWLEVLTFTFILGVLAPGALVRTLGLPGEDDDDIRVKRVLREYEVSTECSEMTNSKRTTTTIMVNTVSENWYLDLDPGEIVVRSFVTLS